MRIDRLDFLAWTAAIAAACTPRAQTPEPAVQVAEDAGSAAPTVIPVTALGEAGVPTIATNEPRVCEPAPKVATPSCNFRNPCGEGVDPRQECRAWVRSLTPAAASAAVACLKDPDDAEHMCDYEVRAKCAGDALRSACPDEKKHRATCERIASGCKKGLHSAYSTADLDVDKCITYLSATTPVGEKAMIACFEEYCGDTDDSCLTFRLQSPRVLR